MKAKYEPNDRLKKKAPAYFKYAGAFFLLYETVTVPSSETSTVIPSRT